MRPDASWWFTRRTWRAGDVLPATALVDRKAGQRVSVVLPALDEADTVGAVVDVVRRELVERVRLVDELVVLDSGSSDATAAVAEAAGATVVRGCDVLPAYGVRTGKGEALWKSLDATDGELLVWLDADLVDVDARFVTGLLTPLLTEPAVSFVKAAYDRPLRAAGQLEATGGGRVTELVARPLLNLHWPALAGLIQPLAGEYAGRRSLLEALPFVSGYGVELGLLVDVLAAAGLDAIAQVDLGRRVHRNSPDAALGRMASAVLRTAELRLGRDPGAGALTQFRRGADGDWEPLVGDVVVAERPPMRTVPEYARRRAQAG